MRRTRKILRLCITTALFLTLVPIINLNVERLAEKYGWDQLLSANLAWFVSAMASITENSFFLVILGAALGGTFFMWVDYFMRGAEQAAQDVPTDTCATHSVPTDHIIDDLVHSLQFTHPHNNTRIRMRNVRLEKDGCLRLALSLRDTEHLTPSDFKGTKFRLDVSGSEAVESEGHVDLTPILKGGYAFRFDIDFFDLESKDAPATFSFKLNGTDAGGGEIYKSGQGSLLNANARVFAIDIYPIPGGLTCTYSLESF